MSRADWRLLAGLGFIGYYLSSLLDFLGLQYISASLERLILFLYPTFVVLLSAWWLRAPVTRRAVGALLLSYGGIALAFWHDLRITGDAVATLTGGGLVLGASVLYAAYLVQAGGIIARVGSLRFVAWAMLASTFFVLAQFALTRSADALAVPSRRPCPGTVDGDLFDGAAHAADRRIDPSDRAPTPRRWWARWDRSSPSASARFCSASRCTSCSWPAPCSCSPACCW